MYIYKYTYIYRRGGEREEGGWTESECASEEEREGEGGVVTLLGGWAETLES
jgi:hypothetical protein